MISLTEAIEYEVRASWWARDTNPRPLRWLAGRYFAWKVYRKYSRYRRQCRKASENTNTAGH